MPGKSKAAPKSEPVTQYPNLERFLEQSERDSAAKLFRETKKKLNAVAGPKGAHATKALAAIERVEGLLGELYEVRLRLEDQARQSKNTRR
jgi:hypothetical protein